MTTERTWVVVLSAHHARQAVDDHRIMTGTGKRSVLSRMSTGDHIVVYSPRTEHPGGEPLSAVTAVGTVTGEQPEGDDAVGFWLAAELRSVRPVPLDRLRDHLPVPLLRFGCVALGEAQGAGVWAAVTAQHENAMAVSNGAVDSRLAAQTVAVGAADCEQVGAVAASRELDDLSSADAESTSGARASSELDDPSSADAGSASGAPASS